MQSHLIAKVYTFQRSFNITRIPCNSMQQSFSAFLNYNSIEGKWNDNCQYLKYKFSQSHIV